MERKKRKTDRGLGLKEKGGVEGVEGGAGGGGGQRGVQGGGCCCRRSVEGVEEFGRASALKTRAGQRHWNTGRGPEEMREKGGTKKRANQPLVSSHRRHDDLFTIHLGFIWGSRPFSSCVLLRAFRPTRQRK